ncbi:hypothetical protein B0H13DRAFT_2249664 [Mycena leptocephala]|nr:hypothetical protein B0H13DRAFT_2249664 [Mycena leptocephala]
MSEAPVVIQDPKPKITLNIVIVGCGITVVESASAIGDVGAGIQVGPNLSRLLIRWGLHEQLERAAVKPRAITFLRYKDGQRVGWTKWGEAMERDHGAPYYHIHRADLISMLLDLAKSYMTLKLNSRVVSVEPQEGKVTLENGEVISGDLLIGADGIKSIVRDAVAGGPPKSPVPTGHAAYRATEMISWMGPGKHIIGYCIRGKAEYNLVMVHPNDRQQESYTAQGSVEKMRADFDGWEPRVKKLLGLVPTTLIWPLLYREPLDEWVAPTGKVVLLGDACHPMLPSRAQGCAMAVEDAAVLGVLFSHISSDDQMIPLLRGYQRLRYDRTAQTQRDALANHSTFHLDDGPKQEERDRSMRAAMEVAFTQEQDEMDGNANIWADKKKSQSQFSYDAEVEAEQ